MLLQLVEVILWVLVVSFLVVQVVVPAWNETALFPFFRKEHKLQSEIVSVHQSAREMELEIERERKLAVLNEIKRQREYLKSNTKVTEKK